MTVQEPVNGGTNLPIAQLKAILQSGNDEVLEAFMHNYSIGFTTHLFINVMTAPNQRVEFLVAIAKTYPNDWKQAVATLSR